MLSSSLTSVRFFLSQAELFRLLHKGRTVKNDRIAVATTMKYDVSNPVDRVRANLATRMVQQATQHGLTTYVLNDGIPPEMAKLLSSLGAKIFAGGIGMAKGRRYILNCAQAEPCVDVVVWTEPENFLSCLVFLTWFNVFCPMMLTWSFLVGRANR